MPARLKFRRHNFKPVCTKSKFPSCFCGVTFGCLKATFFFLAALLIAAVALAADDGHRIKIILIGDSTMTDSAGWGLGFKQFLDPERVELVNASRGGRSSMSFRQEGRWTTAPPFRGYYYVAQCGQNNDPGKPGRS